MTTKTIKSAKPSTVTQKQERPHDYRATESDFVSEIAMHYGFTLITPPHVTSEDIVKAKQFKEFDWHLDTEEKVALLRWFDEHNLTNEILPMMIHYKKPLAGTGQRKKPTEESYGFEIIGSNRSTSEAVLIKAGLAILSDLGYENLYVDINSIGDRESILKFERELQNYVRKHSSNLPTKIKNDFKKNIYSLVDYHSKEPEIFPHPIPTSIGTLSDTSRIHFKEVLEYMEAFNVMYKIQPKLLANKMHASHTIFEIREMNEGKKEGICLAVGYRYTYLAKKLGYKRDVPAMGMTLTVKKNPKNSKKVLVKNLKKPKVYLVQLGNTAKLKVLNIVEMLRQNKIPVYHSITKDKIGGQLSGADYMKATHLLIIGQKEAIDNTVVVRNIQTREQETVSLKDLPEFLRKLK